MRTGWKAGIAAVIFSGTAPQGAAQYVTTIFGHEIYVSDQPGNDRLMIDGTAALSDGEVIIWEIGLAGDAPFILGQTGSGGRMCASVPFVVSFAGETPAVDVLPTDCGGPPADVGDGQILFETPGNGDYGGSAWLWTPDAGFEEVEATVVDPGSGWDAFRRREIGSPVEILGYPDLAASIRDLVGADMETYSRLVSGPPEGHYEGSAFIGSNCISGNCPYGGSFVIADLADRDLYLAWTTTDTLPGEIRPAIGEWPEDYRRELEAWRSQW